MKISFTSFARWHVDLLYNLTILKKKLPYTTMSQSLEIINSKGMFGTNYSIITVVNTTFMLTGLEVKQTQTQHLY